MSFLRPELGDRLWRWREGLIWAVVLVAGLWLLWHGWSRLAPLPFAAGLLLTAMGGGLLQGAVRRLRLRPDAPGEGMVVIDEGRIAYLGPRGGGFVDLSSIIRVEIVTRPHVQPGSGHAWVLTAEDGTRITVPLGAEGAEALIDALSPLPGIDFEAGATAVGSEGPHRATVWRKAS